MYNKNVKYNTQLIQKVHNAMLSLLARLLRSGEAGFIYEREESSVEEAGRAKGWPLGFREGQLAHSQPTIGYLRSAVSSPSGVPKSFTSHSATRIAYPDL